MPTPLQLEFELKRRQTKEFIDWDPTSLSLIPTQEVRTASGGTSVTDLTARAVQVFRLLRMSHTQKPTLIVDGKERLHDFTLLGEWNSVMEVGDYWRDTNGYKYEIVELTPYNYYEKKGLIVKHGKG